MNDLLYKNYGRTRNENIRKYLKNIKIVLKEGDNYFEINDNLFQKIKNNPRGISFTFSSEKPKEKSLSLFIFNEIDVLVKSSSRFFLKPDIGEIFDQMNEDLINKTYAIYLNTENYQIINEGMDHFLMSATLLTDIKTIRKNKLNKLNL